MKSTKYDSLILIAFILIVGCAGTYGDFKAQSESDSKITQQKLIDNWSEYDIRFKSAVIVFDPKNDDKKILVDKNWGTVKDQETWTEIVEDNTTIDGNINPVWASYSMTEVREIWGPDNQLYGFVVHQQADAVNPELVEKNTMRLWVNHAPDALSLDATFSDDGKLTNSFSLGDDVGSGIAIQSDDKIVVAGTIDDGSGSSDLNFLTQYLKR